jgi:putative transposase
MVWVDFLRSLLRQGLTGVQLVTSDAHEGLKAAVEHVPWPGTRAGW